MRMSAVVIVIAVLIAALFAFDGYEYDGHYRAAAWGIAKQQFDRLEHEVDGWLGKDERER